jgi:DNA-binding NarL/FixJ family response regulator
MAQSAPSSNPKLRVLLADDHPIVRAGIRAILDDLPNVVVVGEAVNGRQAVELVGELKADLVIMDISMPGLNGLEATSRITREFPKVKVVILSRHQTELYYWQALRNGAVGYVLKQAALTELGTAVAKVSAGEVYLSSQINRRMLQKLPLHQSAFRKHPSEELSERQREILQLIAEGETTKGIALQLKVSPKTVEYHRAQLMERLNIFDIPGLVRFALKNGFISEE